jgi:hypothetical protein
MRALIFALSMLVPTLVFAQSTISEREAISKIEAWGAANCIKIPVGVFKTSPPPLWSDQERALARAALALEKIGVVKVSSVGNLTENTLTVELKPDFDKSNLLPGDKPCLRETTGLKISKVTKIDGAHGGSAVKWNASLVYILYDYPPTVLAQRYREAASLPSGGFGSRKGVYLFRQDPFNQQWSMRTFDAADTNADLALNNVARSLRGD